MLGRVVGHFCFPQLVLTLCVAAGCNERSHTRDVLEPDAGDEDAGREADAGPPDLCACGCVQLGEVSREASCSLMLNELSTPSVSVATDWIRIQIGGTLPVRFSSGKDCLPDVGGYYVEQVEGRTVLTLCQKSCEAMRENRGLTIGVLCGDLID